MPPRSRIETKLPDELKEWIERWLVRHHFSDYRKLTRELNRKMEELQLGISVSRTAVHNFGKSVEERIASLKKSTEVARMIATEAGDDAGELNDAVQRLIQNKLFKLVLELEVDPSKVDIVKLGHLAADLGRASIAQKKWQQLVRDRAKEAAEKVATLAKRGGASPELVKMMKAEILGIASAP